jgi:hypothetical protein
MGRRLAFCAISALKENLHVSFPFLMRLWRNGAAQSDLCYYSKFLSSTSILECNSHKIKIHVCFLSGHFEIRHFQYYPYLDVDTIFQRKITFFLGQTDESNQDSTEDIATTGNSDNTSDTPVELRKFQDRCRAVEISFLSVRQ